MRFFIFKCNKIVAKCKCVGISRYTCRNFCLKVSYFPAGGLITMQPTSSSSYWSSIARFLFFRDLPLTFNAIDETKTGDKTSFISSFIRTHIQQQPQPESHQIQRLPGNNRYVPKANEPMQKVQVRRVFWYSRCTPRRLSSSAVKTS